MADQTYEKMKEEFGFLRFEVTKVREVGRWSGNSRRYWVHTGQAACAVTEYLAGVSDDGVIISIYSAAVWGVDRQPLNEFVDVEDVGLKHIPKHFPTMEEARAACDRILRDAYKEVD